MASAPTSILFACTLNAVRSPMAAGLVTLIHGGRIWVDSVGVRKAAAADPFAIEVMDEIGVDLSRHAPKGFADLEDGFFDVVVSLSPEAQHHAVEMTRTSACDLLYWATLDPTDAGGTRSQRLANYRRVRDFLHTKIIEEFPPTPGARH